MLGIGVVSHPHPLAQRGKRFRRALYYPVRKPVLTFDTSGLNHLADDPDRPAIVAGLRVGYFTRLTLTSVEEISANSSRARRDDLVGLCGSLLAAGECVHPHNWLLDELVNTYQRNPNGFDWTSVPIALPKMEREIALKELFTDEL